MTITIDCDFPGGNIILETMDGDDVYLHQDLRDTEGYWFYWCFRIRGAAGRRLGFNFTNGDVIGVRGPAISRDSGQTWEWLGTATVEGPRFSYTFADHENDVRFSFGMPYQQTHLTEFLKRFDTDPRLRIECL